MTEKQGKPFTGKKFLAWILGFFLTIITVNGLMAYFAIDTFPGLVTEDAYKKGRDYNETFDAVKEQDKLGWTASFHTSVKDAASRTVELEAMFEDVNGVGISGAIVNAHIRRPARSDMDQTIQMGPAGVGRYVIDVALPADGRWLVSIELARGGKLMYRLDDEFFLKPAE